MPFCFIYASKKSASRAKDVTGTVLCSQDRAATAAPALEEPASRGRGRERQGAAGSRDSGLRAGRHPGDPRRRGSWKKTSGNAHELAFWTRKPKKPRDSPKFPRPSPLRSHPGP